jgi:hypothetical protein
MKHCHQLAVEILTKHLPSLKDAIRFAPSEWQEEASVIAAAFFSSDVRQTCLHELTSAQGTSIHDWFQERPFGVVETIDISNFKDVFVQQSIGITKAVELLLNQESKTSAI